MRARAYTNDNPAGFRHGKPWMKTAASPLADGEPLDAGIRLAFFYRRKNNKQQHKKNEQISGFLHWVGEQASLLAGYKPQKPF